jgi:uncharacterized protein (DUF2461 family)
LVIFENINLGTGSSIKSGGVKLVLRAYISTHSTMVRSYKCFPHVRKMATIDSLIVDKFIIRDEVEGDIVVFRVW